jgi:hypothetical protein
VKKTEGKKADMSQEKDKVTRPAKSPARKCQGVTARGTPCCFPPLNGHEFCLWHSPDPQVQERAKLAAKKGALTSMPRHLPADHPAATIRSVDEALVMVEETLQQVRIGALSPNVGNSVFYGISVASKLLELQVLDQLEFLEAAIGVKLTRREPA